LVFGGTRPALPGATLRVGVLTLGLAATGLGLAAVAGGVSAAPTGGGGEAGSGIAGSIGAPGSGIPSAVATIVVSSTGALKNMRYAPTPAAVSSSTRPAASSTGDRLFLGGAV